MVKKIITFEEAVEIVNPETNLEELLMEIKKKKPNAKYGNEHFFSSKSPFGKERRDKKGVKKPVVCPFHATENDDSTSVLKGDVDVIYCFTGGCVANKAVSPITAVMILELDTKPEIVGTPAAYSKYRQAVYRLAARLGYLIKNKSQRTTPEQKKRMIYEKILSRTAEIYHEEFLNSKEAQEYFLEKRGFKYGVVDAWALIKKYKIGFAPKEFPSQFLYEKLAPDFTTEEMLETSVVKWIQFKDLEGKEKEGKPVDFHSHALTLPYWKRNYRMVTNIYSRGLDAPKKWRHLRLAGSVDEPINFEDAVRYEEIILVEGEMSWLSLIALGYDNTLGNRGTNGLSDEHVELLVKAREDSNGEFCKRIIICFDGDDPGKKATIKTAEKLLAHGFDVKVVLMAEGEDPNDILQQKKENAKSYFDLLMAKTVSFYGFLALSKISNSHYDETEMLREFHEVKRTLEEFDVKSQVELHLIAQEFSKRKKIPFETVWSVWEKKNKETQVFSEQKFAFMTNNYDAFVLTRHVFPGKTAYVEDVTFSFLKEKPMLRNLVIDEVAYDEEEKMFISNFCKENDIRVFPIKNFETIIDMDPKQLMNSLLKG